MTSKVNKHGEVIIKSGVLFKKGSGGGFMKRKNWKPRYFELTRHALRYFTFQDGELKGEINLKLCGEDTLEIMPSDSMKTGASASTIWRIAINTPDRRLLVAAGTEHEMNDWVDALLEVFRVNTTGVSIHHQHGKSNETKVRHSYASDSSDDRTSYTSQDHPSHISDNFILPPPYLDDRKSDIDRSSMHSNTSARPSRAENVQIAKHVSGKFDAKGEYAF